VPLLQQRKAPILLWGIGLPDDGLHARPVRLVPCDDLGAPGDIDTPADLKAQS